MPLAARFCPSSFSPSTLVTQSVSPPLHFALIHRTVRLHSADLGNPADDALRVAANPRSFLGHISCDCWCTRLESGGGSCGSRTVLPHLILDSRGFEQSIIFPLCLCWCALQFVTSIKLVSWVYKTVWKAKVTYKWSCVLWTFYSIFSIVVYSFTLQYLFEAWAKLDTPLNAETFWHLSALILRECV